MTPSGNGYTFTGIDIALGGSPGAVVVVSLLADSNGLPGNVLQSFTFSDIQPVAYNYLPPLLSAVSNAGIVLTANTEYWVSTYNPVGSAGWIVNSNGFSGPEYVQTGGSSGPWDDAGGVDAHLLEGAFRVTGDLASAAVPEPNSLLVLGLGLIILGGIVSTKVSPHIH